MFHPFQIIRWTVLYQFLPSNPFLRINQESHWGHGCPIWVWQWLLVWNSFHFITCHNLVKLLGNCVSNSVITLALASFSHTIGGSIYLFCNQDMFWTWSRIPKQQFVVQWTVNFDPPLNPDNLYTIDIEYKHLPKKN